MSAQLTRWTLEGDTATATLGDGESFDHELWLDADLVALASLADSLDIDWAPDVLSFVVAGGSLADRLVLVGEAGLRTLRVLGGGGVDTLVGPAAANVTWQITGDGSGNVAGVEFTDFENLTCLDTSISSAACIARLEPSTVKQTHVVLHAAGGVVDVTDSILTPA